MAWNQLKPSSEVDPVQSLGEDDRVTPAERGLYRPPADGYLSVH